LCIFFSALNSAWNYCHISDCYHGDNYMLICIFVFCVAYRQTLEDLHRINNWTRFFIWLLFWYRDWMGMTFSFLDFSLCIRFVFLVPPIKRFWKVGQKVRMNKEYYLEPNKWADYKQVEFLSHHVNLTVYFVRFLGLGMRWFKIDCLFEARWVVNKSKIIFEG